MKFLLILLAAVCTSVASAETLFMDQSTTSLTLTQTENGIEFNQIETGFAFGDEYPMQMVFKSTTTSRWWSNADGMEEATVIHAYKADEAGAFQPSWQYSVLGGKLKVLNPELGSSILGGCCGAPDISSLIRLTDGGLVAQSLNDSLLDIRIPNSALNSRYLASVTDEEAPDELGSRTYIGSIGYFSAEGMISQVRIYAALPEDWGAEITDLAPILKGSNTAQTWDGHTVVDLWESDGQTKSDLAFKDFGMVGKIYYETEDQNFSIVVSGDKIDRAASKFSSGLKAVFVK